MDKLIQGLRHFRQNVLWERKELFERSARGRRTLALLITCADSRVLPDTLVMGLSYIDHARLTLLTNWEKQHEATGGKLVLDWETLRARFHTARPRAADVVIAAGARREPARSQADHGEDEMRKVITGVAWWLVLTSPVVGWGLYTWITEPHLHPTTGPHRGGVLVEWDTSHDTVAEITLDRKSGVVTVYVLDRWARRPRPVEARSVSLTWATGSRPVVELAAAPTRRDPAGRSSQFVSGRVWEPGDGSGFAGTIAATANGRQYAGDFGTRESVTNGPRRRGHSSTAEQVHEEGPTGHLRERPRPYWGEADRGGRRRAGAGQGMRRARVSTARPRPR